MSSKSFVAMLWALAIVALQFAACVGTAHAEALQIKSVTVGDPCFSAAQSTQLANVAVKTANIGILPGVNFTFHNTATGQDILVTKAISDTTYFLLPAGNYGLTVRIGSAPDTSTYPGISVKPHVVVSENGKQVCKVPANPGSGGQKTR